MNEPAETKRPHRVDTKLRVRLILFGIISIVLLGIAIYDVLVGQIAWWLSLAGVVAGIVLGYVFGRLMRVKWHETEERIVRQNDAIGIIVIVAYIGIRILQEMLFKEWLSGAALTAFSFAFIAGVLFGRSLGMYHAIDRVLKAGRKA